MDAGISKKIESDDKELEKVITKMLNMVSSHCNHVFAWSGARPLSAGQASSPESGAAPSCDRPRLQLNSCLPNDFHSQVVLASCCSQLHDGNGTCGVEGHLLQVEAKE